MQMQNWIWISGNLSILFSSSWQAISVWISHPAGMRLAAFRSTLKVKCGQYFCYTLAVNVTVNLLCIFQGLLHFLRHLLNGTLSLPLWKEIYFVQNYHHLLAGNLPNYQALCWLRLHPFCHIDYEHHQINNLGTWKRIHSRYCSSIKILRNIFSNSFHKNCMYIYTSRNMNKAQNSISNRGMPGFLKKYDLMCLSYYACPSVHRKICKPMIVYMFLHINSVRTLSLHLKIRVRFTTNLKKSLEPLYRRKSWFKSCNVHFQFRSTLLKRILHITAINRSDLDLHKKVPKF